MAEKECFLVLTGDVDRFCVINEIIIEQSSVTEDSEFFHLTDNADPQIRVLRRSRRIEEQRRNQELKKKQTEGISVTENISKNCEKKKENKKSKIKNNARKNKKTSTSRKISDRNSKSCAKKKDRKKSKKKNNTRVNANTGYVASTSITRAYKSVPESIVRINNEDGETIVTFKMKGTEYLVEIPEKKLTQNMREMLLSYYDDHARRLRGEIVTSEAGTSAESNHPALDTPEMPNIKVEKRSTELYKEIQQHVFSNSEQFKMTKCRLETKVGI